MDSVTKFIILIAGIVVTLLVIAFGFNVYNSQKETGNAALEKGYRLQNQLEEAEWTQYEGTEITGTEVVSVIKHMKQTGTFVSVDNGNGEVNYIFTDGAALATPMTDQEFSQALAKAKKRGDTAYINPNTRYVGEIVRDDVTEAILGIKFQKASAVAGGTP